MGAIPVRDEHGNISSHCFQMGDGTEILAADIQPLVMPPQAKTAPVAVEKPAVRADGKPLSTKALLAQLRSRLREVEREIKLRLELEKERDQIRRLMAAAKQERDNLRRIRAAG